MVIVIILKVKKKSFNKKLGLKKKKLILYIHTKMYFITLSAFGNVLATFIFSIKYWIYI